MRTCSLVLSLAVILLMLVTMSSFAIAACPAPASCSAPACSASAPACCSAPASSARLACDCNCILQPTQEIQKMTQVSPEGNWQIKEGEHEYKTLLDMPADVTKEKGEVKVWVEEKMLVVKAQKQDGKEEKWRIALPENIKIKNIKEKIKAEVKGGVLRLTIAKAEVLPIPVNWT